MASMRLDRVQLVDGRVMARSFLQVVCIRTGEVSDGPAFDVDVTEQLAALDPAELALAVDGPIAVALRRHGATSSHLEDAQ